MFGVDFWFSISQNLLLIQKTGQCTVTKSGYSSVHVLQKPPRVWSSSSDPKLLFFIGTEALSRGFALFQADKFTGVVPSLFLSLLF